MDHVNRVCSFIFAAIMAPMRSVNPWWGMIAVSLGTAVLLLLLFRLTGRREVIARRKSQLVARVLELALFKDDVVVSMGSFGRVFQANLRYLSALLVPFLASLVPMVLIMVQVSVWFGSRPLRNGETTLLHVEVNGQAVGRLDQVAADAGGCVKVDSSPVRDSAAGVIVWRLRAAGEGAAWVDVRSGVDRARKAVAVNSRLAPVPAERSAPGFWSALLNPLEPSLDAGCSLRRLSVDYPGRDFRLGGWNLHWLLVYVLLTMGLAWGLKGPLGVEL
jgi:hypothetical protein